MARKKNERFFFNSLFSFIIYYSVNITQIDNNHGKETEENLKSYYLEQKKNMNLVIKSLVRETSDKRSVVMGKGKGS